ncbi:MYXO-CTERM sorting domain-containing protein [Bradyrhizobium japonicum]
MQTSRTCSVPEESPDGPGAVGLSGAALAADPRRERRTVPVR